MATITLSKLEGTGVFEWATRVASIMDETACASIGESEHMIEVFTHGVDGRRTDAPAAAGRLLARFGSQRRQVGRRAGPPGRRVARPGDRPLLRAGTAPGAEGDNSKVSGRGVGSVSGASINTEVERIAEGSLRVALLRFRDLTRQTALPGSHPNPKESFLEALAEAPHTTWVVRSTEPRATLHQLPHG